MGEVFVEHHVAPQKVVRIEDAQHHVAVRDRHRVHASVGIAHPNARTRAVGADFDAVGTGIDPCVRTRARSQRVNLHQRRVEQKTRHVGVVFDLEVAVGDQGDVERGATNIGTGHVFGAQPLGQVAGAYHAANRPGYERPAQFFGVNRDRAPVAGHDAQIELGARGARRGPHRLQLHPRRLGRVGFEQGGVEARKVLPQRVQLRREVDGYRHVFFFHHLGGNLADAAFVRRIFERIDQVDHNGLDLLGQQVLDGRPHLVLVERNSHLTKDIYPLADAENALAGHQGHVVAVRDDVQPIGVRIAQIGLDGPLQPEVVLHAGRHDDAAADALAFEQAVEHGRAGIDARLEHRKHVGYLQVPVAEGIFGRAHKADGLILGRGLRLANHKVTFFINDEGVRHGAAGVNGENLRSFWHLVGEKDR